METAKLVEIDHVTDYIKMADVAEEIKKICQSCRDTCAELDGLEPDCESGCGIFELKSKVAAIPAADVRPVVRAQWEQVMGKYDLLVRCNKCHYIPIDDLHLVNFCPGCGADMKEVDGFNG